MSIPIQSKAVANHFLELAESEGGITPLKMQKLVYFAHGWHLAFRGTPLIEDEFQAWEYGPVVPTLYHEFKKWGRNNIGEHARTWERTGSHDADDVRIYPRHPSLDDYRTRSAEIDISFVKSLLQKTWLTYKGFSGVEMSRLTHVKDGPWAESRKNNPGLRSVGIPNSDMEKHFKKKLDTNRKCRNA